MDGAHITAAIQHALAEHFWPDFWPEYPVVSGTATAHCHCGAKVRTASAWLEHLKSSVVPETIRALDLH